MKNQYNTEYIKKLLEIMARLRDPETGCPWDLEQTFESIAPYTVEEAYEVADAIERQDLAALRDELGDLLLQVVYHARMAEEAGSFDFAEVARGSCEKMIRRHPHVFGESRVQSAEAQSRAWEVLKDQERDAQAGRVLAGVPVGLPGLTRAVKLGRRAARVGFDWSAVPQVRDKVDEELGELDEALAQGDSQALAAEMGDLLFALANLCRHLGLDPEGCARAANARFESRFRRVEDKVRTQGGDWAAESTDSLERLWQEAKRED